MAVLAGGMDKRAELEEWIEELKASGKLVVVEGIKDERAVRGVGIERVYALNRKALYRCVEEIAGQCKDVVLLTDLDPEGKKLYGTLSSGLQHQGVRIDNKFREELFKKTKLRQIEGLVRYITRIGREERGARVNTPHG